MKSLLKLLVFGATLGFSSCSSEETPPITNPNAKLTDLEQSILSYGYDQLVDLCGSEEANVVISPVSIVSALYMTSEGASEDTYSQMVNALHIQSVTPDQGRLYRDLVDKFSNEISASELSINNQVFVDPSRIDIANSYQEQMHTYYNAQVQELDFTRQAAVSEINDWVADATNDRIKKVLEQISPDEIMFLINASYFKADWANAFPESSVSGRIFTKLDGSQVTAPFMHHDAELANIVADNYKAVELYFKDSIYSMTFIMPSGDIPPIEFLRGYDSNSFGQLVRTLDQEMESSRIFLQIPKLELSESYSLKQSLQNLGMTDAFDANRANFDRFGTSSGNPFLTRVLHDVYLKIDEKGAEGAATTTVGVGVTSAPPSIIFDKPFLFYIKHKGTNVPVFMGVIRDPR